MAFYYLVQFVILAHMKKMTKNLYFWGIIAVIILALVVAGTILYDSGYRIEGFSLQKTGTLILSIDQTDAWVFIDEEAKHLTRSNFETVTTPDISPGIHLVTVIKNGYIPWSKRVDIPSDGELEIKPFIIKTFTEPIGIKVGEKDYFQVYSYLSGQNIKVRTEYSTEKYRVFGEGNLIKIECLEEECSLPQIETDGEITGVYKYDDNSNVILYSTKNGIYITELDGGEKRISHTIYNGTDIVFYPENKDLFVKDKTDLIKLSI